MVYSIHMIASLNGKIIYKSSELRKDSYFIIETSGIGFKVYSPANNLRQIKENEIVVVYTYLAVSESALDLYGFLNPADKTFFTLLLEVPGIGPKSAMNILDKTTMKDVQQAIMENNHEILTKVSGLGQKTAEKIILALRDKVPSLTSNKKGEKGGESGGVDLDVFEALTSFGYTNIEVKKVLSQIDSNITEVGLRVKEALKILGKKK